MIGFPVFFDRLMQRLQIIDSCRTPWAFEFGIVEQKTGSAKKITFDFTTRQPMTR
jgi:hypothetical protein